MTSNEINKLNYIIEEHGVGFVLVEAEDFNNFWLSLKDKKAISVILYNSTAELNTSINTLIGEKGYKNTPKFSQLLKQICVYGDHDSGCVLFEKNLESKQNYIYNDEINSDLDNQLILIIKIFCDTIDITELRQKDVDSVRMFLNKNSKNDIDLACEIYNLIIQFLRDKMFILWENHVRNVNRKDIICEEYKVISSYDALIKTNSFNSPQSISLYLQKHLERIFYHFLYEINIKEASTMSTCELLNSTGMVLSNIFKSVSFKSNSKEALIKECEKYSNRLTKIVSTNTKLNTSCVDDKLSTKFLHELKMTIKIVKFDTNSGTPIYDLLYKMILFYAYHKQIIDSEMVKNIRTYRVDKNHFYSEIALIKKLLGMKAFRLARFINQVNADNIKLYVIYYFSQYIYNEKNVDKNQDEMEAFKKKLKISKSLKKIWDLLYSTETDRKGYRPCEENKNIFLEYFKNNKLVEPIIPMHFFDEQLGEIHFKDLLSTIIRPTQA